MIGDQQKHVSSIKLHRGVDTEYNKLWISFKASRYLCVSQKLQIFYFVFVFVVKTFKNSIHDITKRPQWLQLHYYYRLEGSSRLPDELRGLKVL